VIGPPGGEEIQKRDFDGMFVNSLFAAL